jgi:ComF family protein
MATLAEAVAQSLVPSACAICTASLPWSASRAGVCGACWDAVERHAGPSCPVCGDPDVAESLPCLACGVAPPAFAAAASVGPYRGVLRDLVLLLKHGGRDELARPLAQMLADTFGARGWPRPRTVTFVPTTFWRRLRRGHDQAELLARQLGRALASPVIPTLRRRVRAAQVWRPRHERLQLSPAAFPARGTLSGLVLLVDDVFTTGATAHACSRSLRRAGAQAVHVLTLARTPRSGGFP